MTKVVPNCLYVCLCVCLCCSGFIMKDMHNILIQVCETGPGSGGRLETAGIICLETFKDFPRMARFILRDEG